MFFKAGSETTKGRLSLMERTLPSAGRMPPLHAHSDCEEAYYVLAGEVTFRLDGREVAGGPGCSVLVPSGVPHSFGNTSHQEARLLVIHAPALDAYFRELQSLWSGQQPPTLAAERKLMARHGMQPA